MTRTTLRSWPLVLGVALTQAAAAQQTIPTDLATALAAAGGFTGDGEPTILVGALPPSLRVTLPANSVLLGSASFGRSVTAVVAFRGPSDSAMTSLTESVQAAGWRASRRQFAASGGFLPVPRVVGPSAVQPPTTFCGDSATLTLRAARRRGDSSWIAIRVTPFAPPPAWGECNPPAYGARSPQAPLPVLYNPATAMPEMSSACFRAEYFQPPEGADPSRYNSTRGSLRIGMTPDAIADHYSKQLRDSGWAPHGIAPLLPAPVMTTWTRRDSLGLRMLTLVVMPVPSDTMCYTLNLNVQPARP
jgi:hypothetical protein